MTKHPNNWAENGIKKRLGTGNNGVKMRLGLGVTKAKALQNLDARNVLQKKRSNITDARAKLQIAKQADARLKLNKMKNKQNILLQKVVQNQPFKNNVAIQKVQQNVHIQNVQQFQLKRRIGGQDVGLFRVPQTSNIKRNAGNVATLQKTGFQGRTLMKGGSLMRTVSGAPKVIPPLMPKAIPPLMQTSQNTKKFVVNTDRYHPLPNNPNVVTIKNDKVKRATLNKPSNIRLKASNAREKPTIVQPKPANIPQKTSNVNLKSSNANQKVSNVNQKSRHSQPSYHPYLPQRSTSSDQLKRKQAFKGPIWGSEIEPYYQPIQKVVNPPRLEITTSNDYMKYSPAVYQRESEYESYVEPPRQMDVYRPSRPTYDAYEEEYNAMPPPRKQPLLSSSIISRLDQPQRNPPPHPGYKVVVSNLHTVVSLEDVEELFGNIGPIKYARMIRDGIAEVVFVNEDDAYRSVSIYNNRQLDGQAMSVVCVTSEKYNDSASTTAPFSSSPPIRRSIVPESMPSQYSSRGGPEYRGQTRSVLKAAGGSSGPTHQRQPSILGKPPQREVAPDVTTIHHALFSGRPSTTTTTTHRMSNQQIVVKMPKPYFGRMAK